MSITTVKLVYERSVAWASSIDGQNIVFEADQTLLVLPIPRSSAEIYLFNEMSQLQYIHVPTARLQNNPIQVAHPFRSNEEYD